MPDEYVIDGYGTPVCIVEVSEDEQGEAQQQGECKMNKDATQLRKERYQPQGYEVVPKGTTKAVLRMCEMADDDVFCECCDGFSKNHELNDAARKLKEALTAKGGGTG